MAVVVVEQVSPEMFLKASVERVAPPLQENTQLLAVPVGPQWSPGNTHHEVVMEQDMEEG